MTTTLSTEKALSIFVDAGASSYHVFGVLDGSALHVAQQTQGKYTLVCYASVTPLGEASLALDLSAFEQGEHDRLKAEISDVLESAATATTGRLAEVLNAFSRSAANL